MNPLPINITANKNKHLGEIKLPGHPASFALYEDSNSQSHYYLLTDSNDLKKIYMVIDRDLWNMMFEQNNARFNINNW